MSRIPNYEKSTNAAYDVLQNYEGPYPQIDIFKILFNFKKVKLHTYYELAESLNIDILQFKNKYAPSNHGFTIYDWHKNHWFVFFNDQKSNETIRFTLAHELGHIVLKHTNDDDVDRREANCFARNLLCPVPLRDGYHLKTIQDYCECFNISEYMARITRDWNSSDNYYISKNNYDIVNDLSYVYISGRTLSELYG